MNRHTQDFLAALLWVADDRQNDPEGSFSGKTVNDFAPAFVEAADKFVSAFVRHLEKKGAGNLIPRGGRPFGGNVYFSLSGHGVGFFDDRDPDVAEVQNLVKAWSGYSGTTLRFEELEYSLEVNGEGKIDLAILPDHLENVRSKLFATPGEENGK